MKTCRAAWAAGLATALLLGLAACTGDGDDAPAATSLSAEERAAYEAEIRQWHQDREDGLRQPRSWLALAGLHWVDEGRHGLGSNPMADIVLPAKASPQVGTITRSPEGTLELSLNPGIGATVDGERVRRVEMVPDTAEEGPTVIDMGSLQIHAIQRGDWIGLRVRDAESTALAQFEGLDTFPIDPEWRLNARLERYETPKEILVPDVTGNDQTMEAPGRLVFTVDGEEQALEIFDTGGESLFLIFADDTSGQETYGAGRYLYVPRPSEDDTTTVDFNRAQNPPCAFTPYATCPLPPEGNRLPVAITAGEKVYRGAH